LFNHAIILNCNILINFVVDSKKILRKMLQMLLKNSRFLSLTFVVCLAISACAQKPAVNKAENEGWITSLDEAVALSKKSGKPIMANFTEAIGAVGVKD
jgi:hypothetical protein